MSRASPTPTTAGPTVPVHETPAGDYGRIERLLDHLINPADCIDTFGRSYIDDLEFILAENHGFDFQSQTFPDARTQEWFDRVRSGYGLQTMEDVIAFVRKRIGELSVANSVRARTCISK